MKLKHEYKQDELIAEGPVIMDLIKQYGNQTDFFSYDVCQQIEAYIENYRTADAITKKIIYERCGLKQHYLEQFLLRNLIERKVAILNGKIKLSLYSIYRLTPIEHMD
ncbi:hypothetical protein ABQD97_07760 [Enterococcus avium]|uniref:Helix-turn-helix domain-containing protein n=1 Tax=Enterococcus avium TaxID=33945 RepID=A0AAW8RQR6_ENTAV|nr:hypothetical protein [Enterococcus avium]MDT2388308.1 hypothetical protein [Enterococcus avium]MDT2401463.1 hypothetical protein [Enterococcus avium]MDT2435313.1 hypothetical protein [Enterococcus avium]MDT2482626.1 hypothetical protein [Enterococcus avium]MDT2509322.1 hypothetical protein [Enterococcus avium]